MIVFDLKCKTGHQFEAWFRSSTAYEDQKLAGHVSCPYCNSTDISKAPMAPNVATKSNRKPETQARPATAAPAAPANAQPAAKPAAQMTDAKFTEMVGEAQKLFSKIREHVEKNCDNVGKGFAEEARKIHYGEAEERGIYGTATRAETEDLIDEGIDILPLPIIRPTDA